MTGTSLSDYVGYHDKGNWYLKLPGTENKASHEESTGYPISEMKIIVEDGGNTIHTQKKSLFHSTI